MQRVRLALMITFVASAGLTACQLDDVGRSLGWSQEIADTARDELLAGAKLEEILGAVDQRGLVTADANTGEWTFNYFLDVDGNYEGLGVTVYHDGSYMHWAHGTHGNVALPVYDDAATWVSEADALLGKDLSFAYRTLQVLADFDDAYPGTSNTTTVYYMNDSGDALAYVVLDADQGGELWLERNP